MATCPELDTLKVKGRGKKSLDSFLEYVKATYPQLTTVTVVDDIETLVRDSDVISLQPQQEQIRQNMHMSKVNG